MKTFKPLPFENRSLSSLHWRTTKVPHLVFLFPTGPSAIHTATRLISPNPLMALPVSPNKIHSRQHDIIDNVRSDSSATSLFSGYSLKMPGRFQPHVFSIYWSLCLDYSFPDTLKAWAFTSFSLLRIYLLLWEAFPACPTWDGNINSSFSSPWP